MNGPRESYLGWKWDGASDSIVLFLYTGMTHVKELRTIEEEERICTITKGILKIHHFKLMQGTRVKGCLGKGDTHR